MPVRERIPLDRREQALATLQQLSAAEILRPYRTRRIDKAGNIVDVWITATALMNEAGQMYAIATTERASGTKTDAGAEVER